MRYFVQGVETRTAGALMPVMPVTPRASTYPQVRISGQPGTQGIHSPRPPAIPPNALVPTTQGSNQAPDWFFPSIYYTTADNMHPPVSLFRDNQMPAPAIPHYRLPRVRMTGRRTGSAVEVGQPAVVQRWSGLTMMRGSSRA